MSDFNESDLIEIPEDEQITLVDEIEEGGQDDDQELIDIPGDADEGSVVDEAEVVEGDQELESPAEEIEAEQDQKQKTGKKKSVQERINQITYEKKVSEERAAAAEAKAELLQQRLEELELNERAKETEKLSQREQELLELRKKATADGDLEQFAEANDELIELRTKRSKLPSEVVESVAPAPEKKLHDAAKNWVERNSWFEENPRLADEVRKIESELREGGLELGDKLYQEIDNRLARDVRFSLVVDQVEDKPDDKDEGRPNIPARSTRIDTGSQQSQPGKLTTYDIQQIKGMNLDPNDPKVRKAYLTRKAR